MISILKRNNEREKQEKEKQDQIMQEESKTEGTGMPT
jgi:hypothetical protein